MSGQSLSRLGNICGSGLGVDGWTDGAQKGDQEKQDGQLDQWLR